MAKDVTLAALRTSCKQRCNLEHSNTITTAEWNTYINGSYAELYDLLVSSFEDYYLTELPLVLVNGATIPLPTAFYKLKGLDLQIDTVNWTPMKRFNFQDRNSPRVTKSYRLMSGTIKVEPIATCGGNYKLWYIPSYTTLVSDASILDGINGWEEYIIIDVGIKAAIKQEQSTNELFTAKKLMIDRINEMANNRDAGNAEKVADTTGSLDTGIGILFGGIS